MQRSNIKKITTLFVAVILCSVASFSQITQPAAVIDYVVRKEAVTDPALIPSLSNAEKTKAIAYVDGFGRPLQNIVVAASPGGKDIVSFNKYDEFGRQPIQYLPFEAATNTGAYNDMSTIVAAQLNFYSPSTAAAKKIAGDNYPYSENSFETSPLGRVLKVGGVGDGFQLNQHYKTMSYRNGTAAENVRIWVLNASNATSIDFYADNEFTVSEVMDENNVRAAVYKDKFGRLILKRQDSPLFGFYDTYYVYDNIGNIVYIVPPKAIVKMMGDYNTALTPDLIYQFWYDSKNRIIRKKVPGAAEVYMVYDPLDRVVLTQDGNMRFNGGTKWAYVKYDNANRVIIQGIYTHGSVLSQSAMQSFVDGQPCYLPASTTYYEVKQAGSSGYSNQCFPTGGTEERGYNYFDNYDFNFDGIADYSKLSQGLPNEAPATDLTYGLATGSKKKILGSGTPGTWITEVSFYDKYYHTIQVRSSNQLNSTVADHTTNVVGFTGKAIEARQYKDFTSFNITVGTRYEYDDMERLTKVKQTNPGSAEITVAKYEYNALGQLVDKKLHSADGINYLQSVDMRYNIRGQLLSINNSARNINPDNNDETNDLFGMEIFYDKVESTGLGNTPNYTGMISAIKWSAQSPANTDERSYKYSYDKLYRLTFSQYQAKQSGAWTKHPDGFNESTSYDENGNITSLQRSAVLNNVITQIDALNYSYKNTGNSNQLENISDGITTNAPGYGYRNFTGSTNPYTYDDNGNLNADPKKNTTTTYNELNKPTLIVMPGINTNQVIEYRYDAAGVRISKYVTSGTSTSTLKQIEYVGGYTIEDGRLSYYGMAEGRVRNDGSGSTLNLKMEYFITDQQGNTRVSFEDNGTGTNTAKLTQENSYYAFGMQMEGSYKPAINPNKKLYNAGSEWQDDVEGIADYYSTFFREYDPIIGRFNGVDPMSESFESWTTYHYSYNNPINFNDPLGNYADGGPGGSLFKTGPDGERHIGWAAGIMWNEFGFNDMEVNDEGGVGGTNGGSGIYTNWAGVTNFDVLNNLKPGEKFTGFNVNKRTGKYGYGFSFKSDIAGDGHENLEGVGIGWRAIKTIGLRGDNYGGGYWAMNAFSGFMNEFTDDINGKVNDVLGMGFDFVNIASKNGRGIALNVARNNPLSSILRAEALGLANNLKTIGQWTTRLGNLTSLADIASSTVKLANTLTDPTASNAEKGAATAKVVIKGVIYLVGLSNPITGAILGAVDAFGGTDWLADKIVSWF